MRALCGAIITAGALIGLGLLANGLGNRYHFVYHSNEPDVAQPYVHWRDLDTPMQVAMAALLITLVIGLGIAFLGLAYHHHRRHHEMLHRRQQAQARPPATGPSERITV
jgi:hypothetical protein